MTLDDITQITKELERYEKDLFSASTEYRQLARDAAEKRATYDVAYAQEMLKLKADTDLKATVPERESFAVVAVANFMTACRIAEAMAEGSKRHLQALQAILSSVQTRSKLLQSEWMSGARQA
jgi:hypothetical protein